MKYNRASIKYAFHKPRADSKLGDTNTEIVAATKKRIKGNFNILGTGLNNSFLDLNHLSGLKVRLYSFFILNSQMINRIYIIPSKSVVGMLKTLNLTKYDGSNAVTIKRPYLTFFELK